MSNKFSQNIKPFVVAELSKAREQASLGNQAQAFKHLENAHVLGQESSYWHVKVHWLMFCWGLRNRQAGECFGQLFRIVGAATKTAIGRVPQGNTGGANVSPFKPMPISAQHQSAIARAKRG